jgi:hypothetical protein
MAMVDASAKSPVTRRDRLIATVSTSSPRMCGVAYIASAVLKARRPPARMPGRIMGRVTVRSVCNGPAPPTRAASSRAGFMLPSVGRSVR